MRRTLAVVAVCLATLGVTASCGHRPERRLNHLPRPTSSVHITAHASCSAPGGAQS